MSTTTPLYTASDYEALVSQGILGREDRVELLEGVIVSVTPQSPEHAAGVQFAEEALRPAIGGAARIRIQLPFRAGDLSVPEPDIAVVPGGPAVYRRAHPAEALLIVEVAESSIASDRMSKARVYTGAGIPEYWIVDLGGDAVEVHRDPDRAARQYRQRVVARHGETVTLVALPGVEVAVADVLGPEA